MATLLALLRILMPLIIIFFIWKVFLPRLRKGQQQGSDTIKTDATVVSSEQLKVDLEDYESSEVFVKKEPYDDPDNMGN